jgi:hypothetical protein
MGEGPLLAFPFFLTATTQTHKSNEMVFKKIANIIFLNSGPKLPTIFLQKSGQI